jgi:hypothetical protein
MCRSNSLPRTVDTAWSSRPCRCVGDASVASAGGEVLIARFRVEHTLLCQHQVGLSPFAGTAGFSLLSHILINVTHCQGRVHNTPNNSCRYLTSRRLLPAQGLSSQIALSCLRIQFHGAGTAVPLLLLPLYY